MILKPFLASVFALLLATLNISDSTKTIQESKSTISKKTNQSYYVNGETDVSLLSASDTNLDNSKQKILDPEYCDRDYGYDNYTEFYVFYEVGTRFML